jgi:hypothetical protein
MTETGDFKQPGDEQPTLFEIEPAWKQQWQGMPSYEQKDLMPDSSVIVNFRNPEDRAAFADFIGQRAARTSRSVWFPPAEIGRYRDRRFAAPSVNPYYPVYIISKGRHKQRLTSRALERIGVPYRIVVEPQEYELYAAEISPAKILALPFSNLGQGSIPARNWVWEHSISEGAERHWILDDNIRGFFRFQKNLKTPVSSGAIFRASEEFTDRFENVAISGMNYFMFVKRKDASVPPYTLNTRIYSCILLKNDLDMRWRGRYNEDTDLSLRALKAGWCTVLFNAFLAFKETSMTMTGGNSDALYREDGRRLMAESLIEQHPDCVTKTWKFDHWQHHVNYSAFKRNALRLREGIEIPEGSDEYGMTLEVDSPEGA